MRKPSVGIIFLTVFIDLIGFGIVIPLLPIYGKVFHASGWELGVLMAGFSAMQFVFAPLLGRLSDRIGRRPVLLLSTAGAAVSYVIFACGSNLDGHTALLVIFLSRLFAGLCGANIGVAQAYIADITPPAERSRKMGLIGMAFGLGFICGPVIGGLARKYFGTLAAPGWVAASFCAANFILAFFILPESRKPSSEQVARRPHLDQWLHTMGRPKIGLLISVFFLATFCFTCFETALGLLLFQNFHFDYNSPDGIEKLSYLFAYAGFIGAMVQGGGTGRLVKALGEPKLIAVSLLLVAVSLAALPFAYTWPFLLLLLAVLSIGSSLTRPPVFGMISNLTSANEQGVTIGVAQSMGSLARILGPLTVLPLFSINPRIPYVLCGALSFLTAILAWQRLSKGYESPALATRAAKGNSRHDPDAMKKNPLLPLVTALLLAGAGTRTAHGADFSVSITDGLGRPVSGASVEVWYLKPPSSNVVQRVSLAKVVSDANGLAKGNYDAGAVSANGSVSIEISKAGYATSSAPPQADYVLRRSFHTDDVARIAKLGGDAQKNELRELLAGEFDSPKQNLNELVFVNGNRLHAALRYLLADPQVGLLAGEQLAFMGLPEDLPLMIQYEPTPKTDPAVIHWANDVASSLLEPGSEREWAFLKRCATDDFAGHWVDESAIRTLKLIASARSLQMLNEARRQNGFRTNEIDQAVAYINSHPAPPADKNLAEAGRKTAAAVDAGNWMGNDDPRYNLERDMALIDFNFLSGQKYLIYTATFQKAGDTWKLRGVRETKQTLLPSASGNPAHANK